MGARCRGKHERAIGDRRLHRVVELRLVEDAIGAGSRPACVDVGPAVARLDQAQPLEGEIGHHARGRADVLAELRLDQDDDRTRRLDPVLGLIGSGAGHGLVHFSVTHALNM
jgi:hypothetical protein